MYYYPKFNKLGDILILLFKCIHEASLKINKFVISSAVKLLRLRLATRVELVLYIRIKSNAKVVVVDIDGELKIVQCVQLNI